MDIDANIVQLVQGVVGIAGLTVMLRQVRVGYAGIENDRVQAFNQRYEALQQLRSTGECVGDAYFSEELRLRHDQAQAALVGEIRLKRLQPWNDSLVDEWSGNREVGGVSIRDYWERAGRAKFRPWFVAYFELVIGDEEEAAKRLLRHWRPLWRIRR